MIEWILIYGPPGVGKTVVGERLACDLGMTFYDLDEEIQERSGRSIGDIFARWGEARFRELEEEILEKVLGRKAGVLALGGGTLLNPRNRQRAEAAGRVIFLSAGRAILRERLSGAGHYRPLLGPLPEVELDGLLRERREHYQSFDLRVDTGGVTPREISRRIQTALGEFRLEIGQQIGVVSIQENESERLGDYLREGEFQGPLAVVSDRNVWKAHGHQFLRTLEQGGWEGSQLVLPPGEKTKTINNTHRVWDFLIRGGIERNSTLLALGGGVVGDLGGFAAATILRGICWVFLPTTLLAMVDASLGGKTGVNLPQGKNLVGSFHIPRLVLTDPCFLDTLPEREVRNGIAEVVKHSVIGDPELLEMCRKGSGAIIAQREQVIRRAAAVKIDIVREDPFEHNLRRVLNFGHTIGHALEKASGFRLRHGEAVSIGMVAETRLAEAVGLARPGLSRSIRDALRAVGLPVEIPHDLHLNGILEAVRVDKKKELGEIRFSLPAGIGDVRTGIKIPDWARLIGEDR